MLNESGDLEERLTPGVSKASISPCGGVRLTWGSRNDHVNACWESAHHCRAEAIGVEREASVPAPKGGGWELSGESLLQESESVGRGYMGIWVDVSQV